MRPIELTRTLVVTATCLGGLLAGMAVDKVLVQMPAWARFGVGSWAHYTLLADSGLGLILFPVIGGIALLLSVAAAVAVRFDRAALRASTLPISAAAITAVAALLVTLTLLAPPRLALARAGSDAVLLQGLFASVALWWGVKALLHVLTFGLNLWSLTTLRAAEK